MEVPGRQPGRQLRTESLHTGRRHGRVAPDEHPHHQVGEPPGCGHLGLEQQSGEERAQHPIDHPGRHPVPLPGCHRRTVALSQQDAARRKADGGGVRAQRCLVPQRADRRANRGQRSQGFPARVGQADHGSLHVQQHRPAEVAQVQSVGVHAPPHLWVAGVQHLEAAVQEKAVDPIGSGPAAHAVGCLDDLDVQAGLRQPGGAGQPGQPGTDNDDIAIPRQGHAPLPTHPLPSSLGRVRPRRCRRLPPRHEVVTHCSCDGRFPVVADHFVGRNLEPALERDRSCVTSGQPVEPSGNARSRVSSRVAKPPTARPCRRALVVTRTSRGRTTERP